MTTTRTIRWGIIGTGGIVPRVLDDLRLVEGSEVIAVASRTQARADEFAAAHGIPLGFGELDAMLALPELDAVYIATPHPMHAPDARGRRSRGDPRGQARAVREAHDDDGG